MAAHQTTEGCQIHCTSECRRVGLPRGWILGREKDNSHAQFYSVHVTFLLCCSIAFLSTYDSYIVHVNLPFVLVNLPACQWAHMDVLEVATSHWHRRGNLVERAYGNGTVIAHYAASGHSTSTTCKKWLCGRPHHNWHRVRKWGSLLVCEGLSDTTTAQSCLGYTVCRARQW